MRRQGEERIHCNRQALGFWGATCLVAGSMIGTGIFLKPATMAKQAGSIELVLLAWLVAGLLSYAGALTYGELCARLPKVGGEYAILKISHGPFIAFLYGWMRFTIGGPGSAASYAVGAATFLEVLLPLSHSGIQTGHVAAFFVIFFTFINCLALVVSAGVQVLLTAIKVLSLLIMASVLLLIAPQTTAPAPTPHWPGMPSFAAALMAALWAYDGWNNLPMMGAEVHNPRRNLALALALGLGVVLLTYMLVNWAYFRVLPFHQVATANTLSGNPMQPVATMALAQVAPAASVRAVALLMVIAALGALNGSILSSARVPYAMADDGLFFNFLAKLSRKHAVPVVATVSQGAIAAVLALSGTFDQLTDSVVFAAWIFYGLTASALFVLRQKQPEPAAFTVPGYPYLPLLFIAGAALFVVYAILAMPVLTGLGLLVLCGGVPLYYRFRNLGNVKIENPQDAQEQAGFSTKIPR
ncbi:MAG: amino acid permease [Turneriella sp.]|nr:amino acid permease [Turneriella sp.]